MIQHEMLIANAGSGKTFRLTVRTITLLALGVEPGKIAALTFTRKAAGEFLAAVFLRLARAASDPAALIALQLDTKIPTLSHASCSEMLEKLTTQMHRLCMGTIDSLFGRIARSFPLETGLSGDFSVLGDASRQSACRETLAAVFRAQGEDEERFATFLDLVRQQSRKESELGVFRTLLTSVQELHETFLATPEGVVWGDEKHIWPSGSEILNAPSLPAAADALWQAIISTHPNLHADAALFFEATLSEVRHLQPGQPWSKGVVDLVEKKCSTDKSSNEEYFPVGRKAGSRVYLNTTVCAAKLDLTRALYRVKLQELLRRSRALHSVLAAFESSYSQMVRSQGQLTFSDITSVLACQIHSETWRAEVGYRLDGQFDHWLLDEFQDTSRLQWKVLHGLVDDVIQDTDGTRSFFYVGDTKQAIYSWRGGDPRLFFEIAAGYNQREERIVRANPLDVSYRSDPEIIEVVNSVFGKLQFNANELGLPLKTVADWTQAWVSHEVAEPNQGNVGYVRWQPIEDGGGDENDGSPMDNAIAKILLEVRPWERGWTCACLKRSNKSGENLGALLQSLGIPVAVEGGANPCTDNPLCATLLAAFRFVATPSDALARVLLANAPFDLVGGDEFAFREKTLALIAGEGFAATTQSWLNRMELDSEKFLASRAQEFLSAAAQFDATRTSSDDIGSFIHHIENFQRQEPEGAGVVRIMTIHKAKGLTLDMTIVSGWNDPFCKDQTVGTLALEKNGLGDDWGLLMPSGKIAKCDTVLEKTRQNLIAESAYGELCAAYVAMTRPKHGLYVLTKKLGEKSASKNLGKLLELSLGATNSIYEKGDRDWFRRKSLAESDATPMEISPRLPRPIWNTPRAFGPSAESTATRLSFSPNAARHGTRIHALLAKIEWLSEAEIPQELETFFASPTAREIFRKPPTPHLLWRERAFECEIDGRWVAGIFDRVLIHQDTTETPVKTELVDFKTGSADDATLEKRHAAQMSVYREAVALLLGLDLANVTTKVIGVR